MARILVVDDDECVRQLVCDILEFEGYETLQAEDGFAAIAAVEAERPDCMILDLMMPGMDGHEVLAWVRARPDGAALPVLMLTAAGDDEASWRAWTAGVDYFMTKPFDSDHLLRYLEHLLDVREAG